MTEDAGRHAARWGIGLYLLDKLDRCDRAQVAAHAAHCFCRNELSDLGGLPAILRLLSRSHALALLKEADPAGERDAP